MTRSFKKSMAEERLARVPTKGLEALVGRIMEETDGIVELEAEFVPRDFLPPGNRLGVVVSHQFAYGPIRGKLCERWIASNTKCDNGPLTIEHEGISKARLGNQLIPLNVLLAEGGKAVNGHLCDIFGGPYIGYYNKYFDFGHNIFHHLHQEAENAFLNGKPCHIGNQRVGKHEGYEHLEPRNTARPHGDQNHTYFGLRDDVTHEMLAQCLENWFSADNGILSISQGAQVLSHQYNWFVPSGVLHAPGSELTMEPQEGTDVFSMWQNAISGRGAGFELNNKNYDPKLESDLDGIARTVDLALNKRPATDWMIIPSIRNQGTGWVESWRVFGEDPTHGYVPFVLTRVVIAPGAEVAFSGEKFHNVLCTEGYGTIGTPNNSKVFKIQAPSSFRFGVRTQDEYLITADRAQHGVKYANTGDTPLVVYRCFGRDSFDATELPEIGLKNGVDPSALTRVENAIFLAN